MASDIKYCLDLLFPDSLISDEPIEFMKSVASAHQGPRVSKARPSLIECIQYTFAPSYIKQTSKEPGAATEITAKKKISKYKELSVDNLFLPFAVATMGPWNVDGIKFIEDIERRINEATGEPRSKSFLLQRISIAIQKGNAACVMGTLPPSLSIEEILYLL